MSYCRFSPRSDLYLIATNGGFECLACKLMPEEYSSWYGKDHTELASHVYKHRQHGHKVPMEALKRIVTEIADIPQQHWEKEFKDLMERLAAPNSVMGEFMQTVHTAKAKRLGELINEFADALADLDNLNWPPEDD